METTNAASSSRDSIAPGGPAGAAAVAAACVSSTAAHSSHDDDTGSAPKKEFMFIDEASVAKGWRDFAARTAAAEREEILRSLGEANAGKFHAVGFCQERPVQILSPFSVPPGPLRRAWMNEFLKVCVELNNFNACINAVVMCQ